MGNLRHALAITLVLASCGSSNKPLLATCRVDDECPVHQLCDTTTGACVSGCLGSADCQPDESCNAHGRCIAVARSDGGTPHDLAAASGDSASADSAQPDLSGAEPDKDMAEAAQDMAHGADLSRTPSDLAGRIDMWIRSGACPETDNDHTPDTAIDADEEAYLVNFAICPAGDIDYFRVRPKHDGMLTAKVITGPCGWPLEIVLYNSTGKTVVATSTPTVDGAVATTPTTKGSSIFVRVQPTMSAGQNFYSVQLHNQ